MSQYAAIDIGSNSIRMLAAEVDANGKMLALASERQVVRLGTSVFREGRLNEATMNLACNVLAGMAATYRKLDVLAVRVVGTAALRDARNQPEFLARASTILGTPVEVISGLEEARLVHLGVQSQWPHLKQRLLVADIGGGSTELVLSDAGHIVESFSKPLGAVRLTEMFLKSDPADPRELLRMRKYIQERVAGPAARFGPVKIDRMIATSSTAAAVVCAVNRVRRSRRDLADRLPATAAQVRRLYGQVSAASPTPAAIKPNPAKARATPLPSKPVDPNIIRPGNNANSHTAPPAKNKAMAVTNMLSRIAPTTQTKGIRKIRSRVARPRSAITAPIRLPALRSLSQRRKPASARNSRARRAGSPRALAMAPSLRPAARPSLK
jgi:exopolyphosphatase/pppGpp-phosphohydrolase